MSKTFKHGMELMKQLKAVKEEHQWAAILDEVVAAAEARGIERAAAACDNTARFLSEFGVGEEGAKQAAKAVRALSAPNAESPEK